MDQIKNTIENFDANHQDLLPESIKLIEGESLSRREKKSSEKRKSHSYEDEFKDLVGENVPEIFEAEQ